MKIIPKNNILTFSLPLPIFHSVYVADAINKDGEEFEVFVGLEKKYVDELKRLSLDKSDVELRKNTGDRVRFGEGEYKDWYAKNRTPFCLIHKQTDALAALAWFGPKPLGAKSPKFGPEEKYEVQDDWHTASFRSYPPFRGKGVMRNFSKFAMDTYKNIFPKSKLWVGTDARNSVFMKFISGFDFEIDNQNSDLPSNWLILIKR